MPRKKKTARTKPAMKKTKRPVAVAARPANLARIADDATLWHRLLAFVNMATRQHVQGVSTNHNTRNPDPGWEDCLTLQSHVQAKVDTLP